MSRDENQVLRMIFRSNGIDNSQLLAQILGEFIQIFHLDKQALIEEKGIKEMEVHQAINIRELRTIAKIASLLIE